MEPKTRTEEIYPDEIIIARYKLFIINFVFFGAGVFFLRIMQILLGR